MKGVLKYALLQTSRKWSTKAPLPFFFVEFETNEFSKTIYDLRSILSTLIIVEAPNLRIAVIQCKRCQRLGHIKTYCIMDPVCIKCTGAHDISTCTKQLGAPSKCILCQGDRTINYHGCAKIEQATLRLKLHKPSPHRSLKL